MKLKNLDYLAHRCFGSDAVIRIIDIGGSYRKIAGVLGGRHLEFKENENICLNPFTHVSCGSEEDLEGDLSVIAAIVLQMIYPVPDAMTLIEEAVRWAWETEGNDAKIDTVFEYLRRFPKYAKEDFESNDAFRQLAHTLAFHLSEFTTGNIYGRWFNGKSTFDLSQDEFVVLDLERLKPRPRLFKVVMFQALNEVTRDLYLSDRVKPHMMIFDEARQFSETGAHEMALIDVIREGYRRARRYRGSFTIITRSLLDSRLFAVSADFEKACEESPLDLKHKTTPFGCGVVRLEVDSFSYYVYPPEGAEVAEIESRVIKGIPS